MRFELAGMTEICRHIPCRRGDFDQFVVICVTIVAGSEDPESKVFCLKVVRVHVHVSCVSWC